MMPIASAPSSIGSIVRSRRSSRLCKAAERGRTAPVSVASEGCVSERGRSRGTARADRTASLALGSGAPRRRQRGRRPSSEPSGAAATAAQFDQIVQAADDGAACRAVGRGHRALRQGGEAQARLRRGLLVPGHGLLHAREISRMPGRVQARDTPLAEERRRVRVPRSVRVRPQGLRPRAAAPAAIAHPRRRQGCPCALSAITPPSS